MSVLAESVRLEGRLPRRCPAVPARAAGALLPHDGVAARRRGPGAGDLPAGVEVLRRLRGPVVDAHLALPDRHQHLPDRARRPSASAAAHRSRARRTPTRPPTSPSTTRSPGCEPLPDAPRRASVGSVGDRRVPRVGAAGVRRGAATSVGRGSARCWCCARCCSGRPPRSARRSAPPPPPSTACCSGPARSSTTMQPSQDDDVAAPESPEAQDLLAEVHRTRSRPTTWTSSSSCSPPTRSSRCRRSTAGIRARRTSSRCRRRTAPPRAQATCASCRPPPTVSPPPRCTCSTARRAPTRRSSCTCSSVQRRRRLARGGVPRAGRAVREVRAARHAVGGQPAGITGSVTLDGCAASCRIVCVGRPRCWRSGRTAHRCWGSGANCG